ncbi:MAG: carbamate kinase [Desulfotomaculales bacterium]
MTRELIVVALGGNAIKQPDEKGTTEEQLRNVDATASELVKLIKMGYDLVVTHGNGPQVGDLLIQQEEAQEYVPPKTLYLCGAMTQGQIGWMIQNRLQHHLALQGIDKPVCTVVTQVVVDDQDPDFQDPSKPVGPFYTKEEAMDLVREWGYIVKEVRPGKQKGWRRVVPSPEPIDIVEKEAISRLVRQGVIVIASGGGGIPVKHNEDGSYSGVDAVIDKDLAGFRLAQVVQADKFIILTDVEKAYLNYGKPGQKPLDTVSADEAEMYLNEGHFLMGSMGPKVKACIRFVRWSKKEAIITSLDRAIDALEGRTGTRIVP